MTDMQESLRELLARIDDPIGMDELRERRTRTEPPQHNSRRPIVWSAATCVMLLAGGLLWFSIAGEPEGVGLEATDTPVQPEATTTSTASVTTTTTTAPGADADIAELEANWSVWNAAGRHSYVITYTCDCQADQDETEERQTTVVRGVSTVTTPPSDGLSLSVDTAFALLLTAYTGEGPPDLGSPGKATLVEVTYDPDLGYPVRATLTWPETRLSWEITAIADLPAEAPLPPDDGVPDAESWQASWHPTLALWQLEAARAQYEASGPSSYTLTYERTCYPGCSPGLTFVVSVAEGTIASSSIVGGALPEGSTIEALSIEGLFDLAEQGIGETLRPGSSYRFTLSLHEGLGYPTAFDLDMHRSGNEGFRVTSFVPT